MLNKKILVVDDEQTVCDSINKILSRKGYTVENSLNADEAMSKIKETNFDLVITDLMMPKTSGIELLQIIKEHYPELDVIVVTGYASIDTAVKATKLGASEYLSKPFTPEELTTISEKVLSKKKNKPTIITEAPEKKEDLIDVDLPFSEREITKATSRDYVDTLSRSDVPVARTQKRTAFCNTGQRECRRLVTEGVECAGECPIIKKERERAAKTTKGIFQKTNELIDVDMPFNYSEVERLIGAEYIDCLDHSDYPRAALYGKNTVTRHSVLVVDDEPIVCHSLRRILTKQSCAVDEVFDVDIATQKMKENKYDVVFLDLKMPKKDGMEILKSFKEEYPNTPVIMISGFATIDKAVEATRLGAYQFIPKPFTPEEIKNVTAEVLAG
ncbi:MAG: response regulator [Ignavibacteria bacterium]|nr:response regulator [Ignavibacteria bacterium]